MEGLAIKFLLIWIVGVSSSTGSGVLTASENEPFASEAACHQFAKEHTDRMGDWTRGYIRATWAVNVKVTHRCEVAGQKS